MDDSRIEWVERVLNFLIFLGTRVSEILIVYLPSYFRALFDVTDRTYISVTEWYEYMRRTGTFNQGVGYGYVFAIAFVVSAGTVHWAYTTITRYLKLFSDALDGTATGCGAMLAGCLSTILRLTIAISVLWVVISLMIIALT